ncbi:LysE family translocator [Ferruginivarius sediminum]|nr:LysE family translocator [Ferruginivarius sediminum]
MMEMLTDWSTLGPFLVAALALNLTPGADMTYTIARTAAQGRAAGYASALGIAAGSLIHTVAAAAGLAAILLASQTAFMAVKYIGAAYLIYLAIKLLVQRPDTESLRMPRAALRRVFGQAVLVNVLNPKVALFILALLPQFVDPTRGDAAMQILILGTLFNLGGTAVNCTVATLVDAGATRARNSQGFARIMSTVSGLVLAGLAVRLALTER